MTKFARTSIVRTSKDRPTRSVMIGGSQFGGSKERTILAFGSQARQGPAADQFHMAVAFLVIGRGRCCTCLCVGWDGKGSHGVIIAMSVVIVVVIVVLDMVVLVAMLEITLPYRISETLNGCILLGR